MNVPRPEKLSEMRIERFVRTVFENMLQDSRASWSQVEHTVDCTRPDWRMVEKFLANMSRAEVETAADMFRQSGYDVETAPSVGDVTWFRVVGKT